MSREEPTVSRARQDVYQLLALLDGLQEVMVPSRTTVALSGRPLPATPPPLPSDRKPVG